MKNDVICTSHSGPLKQRSLINDVIMEMLSFHCQHIWMVSTFSMGVNQDFLGEASLNHSCVWQPAM